MNKDLPDYLYGDGFHLILRVNKHNNPCYHFMMGETKVGWFEHNQESVICYCSNNTYVAVSILVDAIALATEVLTLGPGDDRPNFPNITDEELRTV